MAAEPGRQHAVEQVDAEGDGLDERRRVADAHQVARAVGRQVGERGGEGRQHLGPGLAHRQAADAVAVEVELDRAPRRSRPAAPRRCRPGRCRTAPGRRGRWAARARSAHAGGALDRQPRPPRAAHGSGGHTSSTIWMSAPSSSWVATADSGVRRWRRAVVGRAERDAVVVDLGLEREDLEAARVGERQAVPAGEPAEAAERRRRRRRRAAASGGRCCRARSRRRARRSRRRSGTCTAPRVPTGMKHGVRYEPRAVSGDAGRRRRRRRPSTRRTSDAGARHGRVAAAASSMASPKDRKR